MIVTRGQSRSTATPHLYPIRIRSRFRDKKNPVMSFVFRRNGTLLRRLPRKATAPSLANPCCTPRSLTTLIRTGSTGRVQPGTQSSPRRINCQQIRTYDSDCSTRNAPFISGLMKVGRVHLRPNPRSTLPKRKHCSVSRRAPKSSRTYVMVYSTENYNTLITK